MSKLVTAIWAIVLFISLSLVSCQQLADVFAPPGHIETVVNDDGTISEVPVADGNSAAVDAFAPFSSAAGPYGTAVTGGLLLLQNLFLARKKFSRKGQENEVTKALASDLGRAVLQYQPAEISLTQTSWSSSSRRRKAARSSRRSSTRSRPLALESL